MRPETKKKLDHIIFMQRLRYAAIAGGIGLALLAFMLFMAYQEEAAVDKVTATAAVHGEIIDARRGHGRNSVYKLIVKLDDGRSVKAVSLLSAGAPVHGDRIDLNEMTHQSGRRNYSVIRIISK